MATREWLGTTDTSWNTTTNWTSSDTPDDGDDVVVPYDAPNDLLADLDRTGDGATPGDGLLLNSFTVVEGSTVNIGTTSEYLQLASGKTVIRGKGTYYYQPDSGNAADNTARMIIDCPENLSTAVYLKAASASGVKITRLEIRAGGVHVTGTSGIPVATTAILLPVVDTDINTFMDGTGAFLANTIVAFGGSGSLRGVWQIHGGDWTSTPGTNAGGAGGGTHYLYGGKMRCSKVTEGSIHPSGAPVLWLHGGIMDLTYQDNGVGIHWDGIYWDEEACELIKSQSFIDETIYTGLGDGLVKLGE